LWSFAGLSREEKKQIAAKKRGKRSGERVLPRNQRTAVKKKRTYTIKTEKFTALTSQQKTERYDTLTAASHTAGFKLQGNNAKAKRGNNTERYLRKSEKQASGW